MRGLKGKLIDKAHMGSLLEMSDDRAVITALMQTEYAAQLQESMSLTEVEHALKQDSISSYIKLLAFLGGKPAKFLQVLLGRFELLNLKSIIRYLAQKSRTDQRVEPFIFSLGKYHSIPIEAALQSGSLESFVALMKKTPFARALEIGYQQFQDSGELFLLELALDMAYHERVWNAAKSLGMGDRQNVSRIVGIQYDITNIMGIVRFRDYYDLSSEQIYQYIIPHGWKIHRDAFWKLAENTDIVKAVSEARVSPYDKILQSATPINGNVALGMDLALLRYLYRECLGILIRFPFQAAPLMAFAVVKEMQIRDLIAVISGKRLGLSQEQIRLFLITL